MDNQISVTREVGPVPIVAPRPSRTYTAAVGGLRLVCLVDKYTTGYMYMLEPVHDPMDGIRPPFYSISLHGDPCLAAAWLKVDIRDVVEEFVEEVTRFEAEWLAGQA